MDIEPGSEWRYSGGGYVVLQTLVSDVTNQPFPQVMRERVLGPTGMRTPRRGEGVVVMTSSDNGSAVVTEVVSALARYFDLSGYKPGDIDPNDVPAATLQQYAGRYPMPDMPMDMVISFENGGCS